jgi:hypothetical protein
VEIAGNRAGRTAGILKEVTEMNENAHGRIDRLTDRLLDVLAEARGACRYDRKCLLEQGQAIMRMIAYTPRPKRVAPVAMSNDSPAAYANGNGAANGAVQSHQM